MKVEEKNIAVKFTAMNLAERLPEQVTACIRAPTMEGIGYSKARALELVIRKTQQLKDNLEIVLQEVLEEQAAYEAEIKFQNDIPDMIIEDRSAKAGRMFND